MRWLWLISVGASDIQFPVWRKDEYGQWTGPFRFDPGRGGIRDLHEDLLSVANSPGVVFPFNEPEGFTREAARDLRLRLVAERDQFIVGIEQSDFRISRHGDEIPNKVEERLPLYCPKLAPMIDVAANMFEEASVSVVVLNTRRDADSWFGKGEPIAAGPLVAKFLAERLDLNWANDGGVIPNSLPAGTSTWVDILVDTEAMEDPAVQRRIVERLTSVIQGTNNGQESRILATTSGGMPALKPLFERVAATCVGQDKAKLLDNPEAGRGPATLVPLNYEARVPEQEALRFYCAQALRELDYVGAYGMARRYPNTKWSGRVRNLLGPLLELPGNPIRINGGPADHLINIACQVEIRMSMSDVTGAVTQLGAFIESATWVLIERDARISKLGLRVDRGGEFLEGNIPRNHYLRNRNLVDSQVGGPYQHRVVGLAWRWPRWLNQRAGKQEGAAQSLEDLRKRYNKNLREYRNSIIHPDSPITTAFINRMKKRILTAGLARSVGQPFGQNFLAVANVDTLLGNLGFSPEPIKIQVHRLLPEMIET